MLEMTDLHIKSSFRKPKIFTDMILSAVESLYTNFVRGVALNAKFPYIWTPETGTGQSLEKHWRYENFDFGSYFQKKGDLKIKKVSLL